MARTQKDFAIMQTLEVFLWWMNIYSKKENIQDEQIYVDLKEKSLHTVGGGH